MHRERGLTQRGVDRKTGVNYNTISNMEIGKIPEMESVVRWAKGLGLNVNHWLELAGYPPIEETDPRRALNQFIKSLENTPPDEDEDFSEIRGVGGTGDPEDLKILRAVRKMLEQRGGEE